MITVLALTLVATAALATVLLFQVGRRRPSMPAALLAMAAGGAVGYPIGGNQAAAICFSAAAVIVTLGYVVGPRRTGDHDPPHRLDRGGPTAAGS
ncbi:MAG: hypothetical protein U0Q07_15640 [Acidimicrobiales bacterium]